MNARTPSSAQLRALVAVADHLHFGAAAGSLRVSQPAVSTAVAALEDRLGVRLVERTTRQVLVTPAGERVVAHARRVIAELDALVEAAERSGRPHTGPLRLGVIPTVAPYVLPTLLRALHRDFPRVAPDVTEDRTGRLLGDLAAGRLDLALVALPVAGELVELPLYREDFVLLLPASHALAGSSQVPASALRELGLLLLEDGHCLRDQALDVCRQVGARTDHPARAASLATLTELVAAGLGTTLLPASAVPSADGARLATARFGDPVPGRTIGLVHRTTTPRAAEYAEIADRFRAAIRRARLPVSVGPGAAAAAR